MFGWASLKCLGCVLGGFLQIPILRLTMTRPFIFLGGALFFCFLHSKLPVDHSKTKCFCFFDKTMVAASCCQFLLIKTYCFWPSLVWLFIFLYFFPDLAGFLDFF